MAKKMLKCLYSFCRAVDDGNSKFKKCGSCIAANYCSKKCQRKDWSAHKNECMKHVINENLANRKFLATINIALHESKQTRYFTNMDTIRCYSRRYYERHGKKRYIQQVKQV